MAAFSNTNHAVSAALDILKRIDDFNRAHVSELQDGSAIVIKLGVHVGPAIIVTLNDRLDYFGSTVNLAARLQAMAKGGQVVLSTAAMAEPEVDDLVSGLRHKSSYEELKGFQEKILIHRYAI